MFPKSQRVSRAAFASWYTKSRRYHTPIGMVCYVPHHELLVAVVVSKKVAKQAVERNRLRRRMYALLRVLLATHTGVFIFITKPPITTTPRLDIQKHVCEVFGRITKST